MAGKGNKEAKRKGKDKKFDLKKMNIEKRLKIMTVIIAGIASLSGVISMIFMIVMGIDANSGMNNYGFATGNVASSMVCITDS